MSLFALRICLFDIVPLRLCLFDIVPLRLCLLLIFSTFSLIVQFLMTQKHNISHVYSPKKLEALSHPAVCVF